MIRFISFRKQKLIGDWQKSRAGLPDTGADIVLFNVVNAFKFPDNAQVYITCNVEVGYHRTELFLNLECWLLRIFMFR